MACGSHIVAGTSRPAATVTGCRLHQVRTWGCQVTRLQLSRSCSLHSNLLCDLQHQQKALRTPTRLSGPGRFSPRAASSGNGALSVDDSPVELRSAVIVAEPPEDRKIKLRVDVPGQDTQRAFDVLLVGLAKNSPPVPGFRKSKGGKTSAVPKNVLLQLLGASRVRKFVIEEVVRSALSSYVKKEKLLVKDSLKTSQSADELYDMFEPGKDFGFDAEIELEETSVELDDTTKGEDSDIIGEDSDIIDPTMDEPTKLETAVQV